MVEVVDLQRPVEAVIPGAQGRVLEVLAQMSTELNLRTIAGLARVSPAQASRVLPGLVRLGIAERRDIGTSALFRLVPENVASRALLALARAHETALAELGRTAAGLTPPAVSVIVFGSFARGDATPASDLDLLVVRSDSVDADDDDWNSSVERWRVHASRLTGNAAEVLQVAETEARELLASRRPLWIAIRREGVLVAGLPLSELRSA